MSGAIPRILVQGESNGSQLDGAVDLQTSHANLVFIMTSKELHQRRSKRNLRLHEVRDPPWMYSVIGAASACLQTESTDRQSGI